MDINFPIHALISTVAPFILLLIFASGLAKALAEGLIIKRGDSYNGKFYLDSTFVYTVTTIITLYIFANYFEWNVDVMMSYSFWRFALPPTLVFFFSSLIVRFAIQKNNIYYILTDFLIFLVFVYSLGFVIYTLIHNFELGVL